MSETFTVLELDLPAKDSKRFGDILRNANGPIETTMFAHYGQLADGVESFLEQHDSDDADWVPEQLTSGEALIPYGFRRKRNKATMTFISQLDPDRIQAFSRLLNEALSIAGIDIVDAWYYTEDDLDERVAINFDGESEESNLMEAEIPVAIVNLRIDAERADEITRLLRRTEKFNFLEYVEETGVSTSIFEMYDLVSPGLGGRLKTIANSKPAWESPGIPPEDTLYCFDVQITGDITSMLWINESPEKCALLVQDLEAAFTEAGIEVLPMDAI